MQLKALKLNATKVASALTIKINYQILIRIASETKALIFISEPAEFGLKNSSDRKTAKRNKK
jgi:hypothetical protein